MGLFQSLPGALDIRTTGARQRGNDRTMHDSRNAADRLEITFGGDGKAGFDYVNAQAVELMRQTQLLLMVHAATGRLFSVAKRAFEYGNARSFRGHGSPSK